MQNVTVGLWTEKLEEKMAEQDTPTRLMIELQQKQAEQQLKAAQEEIKIKIAAMAGKVGPILNQNDALRRALEDFAARGEYQHVLNMLQQVEKQSAMNPATLLPHGVAAGPNLAGAQRMMPDQAQSRAPRPRYMIQQKLSMRMGWSDLSDAADKHSLKLHLVHDSGKVFIFGVKNGESFVLQDEADIFPSDQIVTQMRMVCG